MIYFSTEFYFGNRVRKFRKLALFAITVKNDINWCLQMMTICNCCYFLKLIMDYVLVPCLQHVFSEPFEPSPFFPTRGFDDDYDVTSTKQQVRAEGNMRPVDNEKEISTKESNVAKIKVVVCLKNLVVDSKDVMFYVT